ncbi:CocE/NonD family hydrolase C-terminal non-catalytic domain-containing protein [Micromonospora sp. PLK6-60]|uniref:CocE/NonD family hydrolase C-terminal non-catalytic domain-containing protein n=1 Tax=Micromonospora sp. PLK6-60 TaxID=2873383 RepID=UPI0027E0456B|nr:CocE/NonD family hydrolase C-terminal non-catalytic domain-containing protein [Micromonospora sp. PLK6-60]
MVAPPCRGDLLPGTGALERGVSPASPPSTFTYDPNDPTPSVGGPKLDGNGPGPRDNRSLEKRAGVLTFTSPVLESDLEVVGQVTAQVWLRADRPSNDLFVRLCDVDERGKSINVCDDLVTVRPDGTTIECGSLGPIGTAMIGRSPPTSESLTPTPKGRRR